MKEYFCAIEKSRFPHLFVVHVVVIRPRQMAGYVDRVGPFWSEEAAVFAVDEDVSVEVADPAHDGHQHLVRKRV